MRFPLAGMNLESPIMNAAGTVKHDGEFFPDLLRAPIGTIMVGSITSEFRSGNDGDVYYQGDGYSLNFFGLPNPGAEWYETHLSDMVGAAHSSGKRLFLSIVGLKGPDDFARLACLGMDNGVDLIEINCGCPNVWDGGRQKRIVSFDPEAIDQICLAVTEAVGGITYVAVKLSPISDPVLLGEVAAVLAHHDFIRIVTSINTFPNAVAYEAYGKPTITTTPQGYAGLAGSAVKAIGLGQIVQLRAVLPKRIVLMAAGGVSCGQDVVDYLHAGASIVQVGTALINRGPRVFSEILTEYADLIEAEPVGVDA